MMKTLFPALALLMLAGTSVASAQSGPWYVLFDRSTNDCFAAHRVSSGGEEETISGPLPSQLAAVQAAQSLCGGASYGDPYSGAM